MSIIVRTLVAELKNSAPENIKHIVGQRQETKASFIVYMLTNEDKWLKYEIPHELVARICVNDKTHLDYFWKEKDRFFLGDGSEYMYGLRQVAVAFQALIWDLDLLEEYLSWISRFCGKDPNERSLIILPVDVLEKIPGLGYSMIMEKFGIKPGRVSLKDPRIEYNQKQTT